MTSPRNESATVDWINAQANVTACEYEAGVGRALAFGLPTRKHFRISYTYRVRARTYTGEFRSAKVIAQGEVIPLSYNPLDPQQNIRSNAPSAPSGRGPLLAVGVIGSVVVSLLWLALMRGCS